MSCCISAIEFSWLQVTETQPNWLKQQGDLLVHTTGKAGSRADLRHDLMQEFKGNQFLSLHLLSLLPLTLFSDKFSPHGGKVAAAVPASHNSKSR